MTDRKETVEYTFVVKEGGVFKAGQKARTYLACEPKTADISVLNGGSLSLRLREGTSVDDAQEIARYLQKHVVGVAYDPLP